MLRLSIAPLFLASTIVPLAIAVWWWKRLHFNRWMALYLFILAPYAGALGYVLAIEDKFVMGSFLAGAVGYLISVWSEGGGWGVLIGVLGWTVGVKIQARAQFGAIARFAIGGFLGLVVGVIFLLSWDLLFVFPALGNDLVPSAIAGACAGATGGIIVVAFVPRSPEIESGLPLANPMANWPHVVRKSIARRLS